VLTIHFVADYDLSWVTVASTKSSGCAGVLFDDISVRRAPLDAANSVPQIGALVAAASLLVGTAGSAVHRRRRRTLQTS
jgi:hypothetical protein